MHAVEVAETGDPEVLRVVDKPTPSPATGEVLIKADAIGVNYIDTYFRSGTYPRPLPFVVGTEVCGTVAAIGDDVPAISVGDRVVTANAVGASITNRHGLIVGIPSSVLLRSGFLTINAYVCVCGVSAGSVTTSS
jgi:NADPH:quinone reductase-like Zn-dependent oxidoreductase